ncbi:hypothetical protein A3F64_01225 [Candidatus Saccharibacteria bacterium RIFCSPHIGHO2_12_FULL_42_8]|nr:MAG: hypothetical protein A3F64_01225 [Candidatus Saccharibacteria bacterium RIFCSPHIGHO2_12_FULL_42_8]
MADTTHERVVAGRYEEIDEIIAELSELSLDNNGGVYSKNISDEAVKQVQALLVDPYARAIISSHYWTTWELKDNQLKVRRRIK